ncbi:MAG: monovalent cation/H(+) antiporter subunit G, partial [Clostridia bacterium]|nr:monovalent cation/H(+) antiporter subunit G [Clostridia bacterium]
MKTLALIFLLSGFFFITVAALGVIRFPDFYTRLHAAGKGDTLGIALFVIGLAIHNGFN